MWLKTDWDLCQLRDRLPQPINSGTLAFIQFQSKWLTHATPLPGKSTPPSYNTSYSMVLPYLSMATINNKTKPEYTFTATKLLVGDPIDLSLAIITVKRKSLHVPGVKKICDDYKLCYYYK